MADTIKSSMADTMENETREKNFPIIVHTRLNKYTAVQRNEWVEK